MNAIIKPLNTAKNSFSIIVKYTKTLIIKDMKTNLLSIFKQNNKKSVDVVSPLLLLSMETVQ